jgi:hypothetical protein
MSSYTGRGSYMAWLRYVAPSARHPRDRWQVRYRDASGKERSAGIYHSPKAAEAIRKRIDRGLPPTLEVVPTTADTAKAQTLFGDYAQDVWWPTWKVQHPESATRPASGSRSGSCPPSAPCHCVH